MGVVTVARDPLLYALLARDEIDQASGVLILLHGAVSLSLHKGTYVCHCVMGTETNRCVLR
jgi:hypothetical protein